MTVYFSDDQDEPHQSEPIVHLAELTLRAEGLPEDTEVSIMLVNGEEIARLNEQFLGREGPTDVLSFPLEDLTPGVTPAPDPQGPPLALGDVFICPQVVRLNAAMAAVPLDDEMALMVVHGLLHLLGYDHEDDADAERMESRERELLAEVGRVRP